MNSPASLPRLALTFEIFLTIALAFCGLAALVGVGTVGIIAFSHSTPASLNVGVDIEMDNPPDFVVHTTNGTPVNVDNILALAKLEIPDELRALQLGSLGATLVVIGFSAALLHQMRAFVRSLRTSQPFTSANALRLRRVAGLSLVGSVIYGVIKFTLPFFIAPHFPDLQLNITLSPNFGPLFFSITIFIIAEVFSIGVAMKEEQDLTV